MGMAAQRYGISESDWERQLEAAIKALKRVAALRRVTTYTDLNREVSAKTDLAPFDFTHPEGRNAMSELLGEVVERTVDDLGAMLSAVVLYLDENDAGPGFYSLAVTLGRLPADASTDDKFAFWARETKTVQAACKPLRRQR